jgi:hypothetical protein
MHEGDHSLLDEDHDHQTATAAARERTRKIIAGAVVAAAAVLFLLWRFL